MPCGCDLSGWCGQIRRKLSGQGDLLESPGLLSARPNLQLLHLVSAISSFCTVPFYLKTENKRFQIQNFRFKRLVTCSWWRHGAKVGAFACTLISLDHELPIYKCIQLQYR